MPVWDCPRAQDCSLVKLGLNFWLVLRDEFWLFSYYLVVKLCTKMMLESPYLIWPWDLFKWTLVGSSYWYLTLLNWIEGPLVNNVIQSWANSLLILVLHNSLLEWSVRLALVFSVKEYITKRSRRWDTKWTRLFTVTKPWLMMLVRSCACLFVTWWFYYSWHVALAWDFGESFSSIFLVDEWGNDQIMSNENCGDEWGLQV